MFMLFLLRIAAALESKKSRLMSITIPAYLPAVCKGCAFSDLVLVSSEGEHLSCHRDLVRGGLHVVWRGARLVRKYRWAYSVNYVYGFMHFFWDVKVIIVELAKT